MNDAAAVRVTGCGTSLAEKFQSLRDRKSMLLAILVDRKPFDVLHHEIRQPVLGGAPVEQTGNIGVIEAGKYLPLITEVMKHRIGIHTALDQLNSDPFFVLMVCPLSQIHPAHSASADSSQDFVVTNRLTD
jgi:hypothetical protein